MREYEKHVRTVHNDLEQLTKCPRADECGSDKVFTKKTNLRMHLEEQHAVKNEDMPKYVEKAPADPELRIQETQRPLFIQVCGLRLPVASDIYRPGRSPPALSASAQEHSRGISRPRTIIGVMEAKGEASRHGVGRSPVSMDFLGTI